MSKYTTLVFKSDTKESLQFIRELSQNDYCRAWSLDHEILRLELIEKALDEGDIEKAKGYIGDVDITKHIAQLEEKGDE